MLNELNFMRSATNGDVATESSIDLCPSSMQKEIDTMNDFVYEKASKKRAEIVSLEPVFFTPPVI